MQDIFINGEKVRIPFIFERSFQGVRYLVSYDTINEIDENNKCFVMIELNDGFVYKMSKRSLEDCLKNREAKIKPIQCFD